LAISAGSRSPDAAWELVKFGCSPGMNLSQMVTPGTGIDPVYKSTLESEEYKKAAPKVQAAARQALNGALVWPNGAQAAKMLQGCADQAGARSRQIEDAGKGNERHASDVGRVAWRITRPRASFAIRRGL
jgi:ABC-type glycerol-3-phosphate transport system substrate-binding protein